jgi:transcriptional regulator with GAF, ATPase, and Fis domain
LFLVAVLLVTVFGLATAIPPLLSKRPFAPWPWEKTDLVLLAGLSLTVLAFVVYLTQQQRRVLGMQRELHGLQQERAERTRRHYARLFALLNVSRIMGLETNLQEVFDCITRLCVETFTGNRSSLMLYDKDAGDLVIRSANGDYTANVVGRRRDLGEGIAGWSALHRRPLFLSRNVDLRNYPGLDVEDTTILAAMVVPIIVREELVGVLNVSTQRPDVTYDEEDLRALQVFAENAGACIRHTEHADWMRLTIDRLQATLRERQGHAGARSTAEPNAKPR